MKPRADPNDLLGDGWCKKKLQESFNRGFFYVWADKVGTQRDEHGDQCVAGNYEPVWESTVDCHYDMKSRWAESHPGPPKLLRY